MRGKLKDMAGQRFGRLTVVERDGSLHGAAAWKCVCDCGNSYRAYGPSLRKGATKSCGCLPADSARTQFSTHGKSKTPEYRSWLKMRDRCLNEGHHQYSDYGGRGISVCDWWAYSFEHFIADMGQRPTPSHTLEREDNEGDYEPGNCRWATRKEQNRNTRVVRKVRRSDGSIYASIGAAIEEVGGSESALRYACASGKGHLGFFWSFVGQGETAANSARAA